MFPFPPEFFFFYAPIYHEKNPLWRPHFLPKNVLHGALISSEKCRPWRPHSPGKNVLYIALIPPGKNVLYCAPHFQGKNVLCGASIPPGKMSVPAAVTLHFFIVQVAEAMFGPNMRVEGPRVVEDPKQAVGYKIKLPFRVFRDILINQ